MLCVCVLQRSCDRKVNEFIKRVRAAKIHILIVSAVLFLGKARLSMHAIGAECEFVWFDESCTFVCEDVWFDESCTFVFESLRFDESCTFV